MSRGDPVGRATDFSVPTIKMKFFPYEHFSPGNRDETFLTKWLLPQHGEQNGKIFAITSAVTAHDLYSTLCTEVL